VRVRAFAVALLIGACATTQTSDSTHSAPTTSLGTVPPTTTTAPASTGPGLLLSHDDVAGANHLLVGAVAAADGIAHAYVVAFDDERQWIVHVEWPLGTNDAQQTRSNVEDLGFDFSRPGPIPTSLVSSNDEWLMYGQGLPEEDPEARIFWAISAGALDGPWQRDPGVVMRNGDPGQWDHNWIDFPAVIRSGPGYQMAYQGAASPDSSDIGLATSVDGAEWARPDQPLIRASQCEGSRSLVMPRLVQLDSSVALAYIRVPEVGDDQVIALDVADSTTNLGCGEMVLSHLELPSSGGIHSFGMFAAPDGLWLLVESLSSDFGSSDLYLVPVDASH